jgi:hypothetical protein
MSWFHVTVDEGATELVTQIWDAARRAGTDLRQQAVFKRRRSAASVALFFSPAAAGLARIFGARRCRQPRLRGLQLLVGTGFAWAPPGESSSPVLAPPAPRCAFDGRDGRLAEPMRQPRSAATRPEALCESTAAEMEF